MSMMALMAAGCSSDDITVNDGGQGNGSGLTQGTGYVALNITLPTVSGGPSYAPGTRTVSDPTFDHGTPTEYQVNTLTISFYNDAEGTGEPIETISDYDVEDLNWSTPGSPAGGITTTALLPVHKVNFSGNAYALVEINKPNFGTPNTDGSVNVTAQTLTGALQNNFYMTNTVYNNGKALVEVTSYTTEFEAKNNAKSIHVERAVAKVDLKTAGTDWAGTTYTAPVNTANVGDVITLNGWKLDITNKKMFPVRKFPTNIYTAGNYERFYGTQKYSTFWAVDPNYSNYDPNASGNGKAENFNFLTATDNIDNTIGYAAYSTNEAQAAGFEYCLENTFDTKHQKQNETTRALIKATYKPAGLTFTGTDNTWYTIGNSSKPYTKEGLQNKIKEILGAASNVTLSNLNAGTTTIEKATFHVGTATEATDEELDKVQKVLGTEITTYANGVCYYVVRVKHGGDSQCAWTAGEDYTQGTMETKYLGRYGVVRNNWYRISVKTISQPGSPTIPTAPSTSDDEQNYYLQAEINILDWAVRTQDANL